MQSVKLQGSELELAEDAHPAISVQKDLDNLKRRFLMYYYIYCSNTKALKESTLP
jgi:hypothetical protein